MTNNHEADYIVFYGTLMRGFPTQDHLGLRTLVSYQGDCLVGGDLHDLGLYPGLVQGDGQARGELYRVDDPAALSILDQFEDYHPGDPDGSEYLRLLVDLRRPARKAWIYYLNREPKPSEELIPGGCWKDHYREHKSGDGYWSTFLDGRPDME